MTITFERCEECYDQGHSWCECFDDYDPDPDHAADRIRDQRGDR